MLALEHFVVVQPEQHLGPHPVQLCAYDPAVNQPQGGADASEKARNRKRVLADEAPRNVMVEVKEGHRCSSKHQARTLFAQKMRAKA
jgi:hypothetical protein